jgi:hypothetical protein
MAVDITHILPEQFLVYTDGNDVNPRVKEIYRALHRYASSDARQEWIKQADECRQAALENKFFTAAEETEMKDMGAEPHVVNKLVTGVQGSSAIATANRPDIKVFPLRESDPYLAELAKNGLEHVWLKNYGNDVVYDTVEERNISGIGAMYARLDENKGPFGACVFEEDDASLWYWDEESKKRDRSDTHLIKAQLRSLAYIKAHYPELKDDEIVAIQDNFERNPVAMDDTATGEDNYRREEKHHEPHKDGKKRMVWEIEAYMLRVEREQWAVVVVGGNPFVIRFKDAKTPKDALEEIARIERDGLNGQPVDSIQHWPRKLNNRYLSILVGVKIIPQPSEEPEDEGKEVDEVLNPLGLDSDGDPILPVVFYYGQRTSKAYYHAPTFYALGPNRSLCKRETQYTHAVSKNLSAPVVREETGTRWKDPKRPDRPGNELLISKSNREPSRLNPGLIDLSALTARIVEDKSNIDEAFGLPEVMQGKVPKGLERMSGRLGLALQDTAVTMHNPSIRSLESALEYLGKLLLAIILRAWPRSKWEALVTEDRINEFRPPEDEINTEADENKGPDLIAQEKIIRQQKWAAALDKITTQGMTIVDFNIAITAGSSLPTNRLLKEEAALEKYNSGLYDRRAALEYSGDPHAKEIAARIDKREMEMAQAGAKLKKG